METNKITDLKDMLKKSGEKYPEKIAYKIRIEQGKYKEITHKQVRDMIDSLGTALIDMGLKGKRIGVIGENRYEWEIAYLSIVCRRESRKTKILNFYGKRRTRIDKKR